METRLDEQSFLCFTFFSQCYPIDVDDIFVLDNLDTDPESMLYCFTYYTKDIVKLEKLELIINGDYNPSDFKDDKRSITINHRATCINDVGRIIRYWINKYYPLYATKPLRLYYMGEVSII